MHTNATLNLTASFYQSFIVFHLQLKSFQGKYGRRLVDRYINNAVNIHSDNN